jgi:hypothetical protein
MKTIVIAVLLSLPFTGPMHAQAATPSTEPLVDRQRIRTERAKDAEETKGGVLSRPWDKDADGKRPWDKPVPVAPK